MYNGNVGEVGCERRAYRVQDILAEPFKHFDYGLGVGGRTTAERYAEGEIEVHAHFLARIDGGAAVSQKLCAVAHARAKRVGGTKTRTSIAKDAHVASGSETSALSPEQRNVKQAVLVNAREFVELPEGVEAVVIPRQIIRLQILDDCLSIWGDVSYSPLGKFPFVFGNGEHQDFFDVGGQRISPVVGDSEVVDEVVQSRTKLMETIAKDEVDLGGRQPLGFGPEGVLASLRMVLLDDVVRVGSQPPLNFGFQALQVLQRPIQPESMVVGLARHEVGA